MKVEARMRARVCVLQEMTVSENLYIIWPVEDTEKYIFDVLRWVHTDDGVYFIRETSWAVNKHYDVIR